jgi:hypothetical protein
MSVRDLDRVRLACDHSFAPSATSETPSNRRRPAAARGGIVFGVNGRTLPVNMWATPKFRPAAFVASSSRTSRRTRCDPRLPSSPDPRQCTPRSSSGDAVGRNRPGAGSPDKLGRTASPAMRGRADLALHPADHHPYRCQATDGQAGGGCQRSPRGARSGARPRTDGYRRRRLAGQPFFGGAARTARQQHLISAGPCGFPSPSGWG